MTISPKNLTLLSFAFLFSCRSTPEDTTAHTGHSPQQEHGPDQPVLASSKEDTLEQHLRDLFRTWQANEIAEGHMWAADSCRMDWFSDHEAAEGSIPWGFPDSADIAYSYADLNLDGKTDQLVTFNPSQCDGGNGSMWSQIEVLIVSSGNSYETIASSGDGMFSFLGKDSTGFCWYDSIGPNKIYGTYYNFSEDDGHCCPGTVIPVIFSYDTRKIIYRCANTAQQP